MISVQSFDEGSHHLHHTTSAPHTVKNPAEATLPSRENSGPSGVVLQTNVVPSERGTLGLKYVRCVVALFTSNRVAQGSDGLVVKKLDPGSPAAAAGVKPGDKIVSLDGQT